MKKYKSMFKNLNKNDYDIIENQIMPPPERMDIIRLMYKGYVPSEFSPEINKFIKDKFPENRQRKGTRFTREETAFILDMHPNTITIEIGKLIKSVLRCIPDYFEG